jgi:hypothetical protein
VECPRAFHLLLFSLFRPLLLTFKNNHRTGLSRILKPLHLFFFLMIQSGVQNHHPAIAAIHVSSGGSSKVSGSQKELMMTCNSSSYRWLVKEKAMECDWWLRSGSPTSGAVPYNVSGILLFFQAPKVPSPESRESIN